MSGNIDDPKPKDSLYDNFWALFKNIHGRRVKKPEEVFRLECDEKCMTSDCSVKYWMGFWVKTLLFLAAGLFGAIW